MSATTTVPTLLTVAEALSLVRISEIPGAALPLDSCSWPEDQLAANERLLSALGEATGRLKPQWLHGHMHLVSGRWRLLTEERFTAIAVESAVKHVRREFPGWCFDAEARGSTIDRLDEHFAAAQARRLQSASREGVTA